MSVVVPPMSMMRAFTARVSARQPETLAALADTRVTDPDEVAEGDVVAFQSASEDSVAIQLAIGLELDMDGTQKLLNKAGYSLTRSSRADLVVQYYIERKMYCVPLINAALDDCRLPLLKTGLKA